MIVKFIGQIDPQRITEWENFVQSCETIITDYEDKKIGSEIYYDEDEVFCHWERILQSVLTHQNHSV